jgi:glycerophosphoryl diester phosphodiesterase
MAAVNAPVRPLVWAHRGCPTEAPENTLAAFAAAVDAGADGVEFDVQLSRDGVPVVIHDETLDRTTDGHGPVGAHTAAQLAALDAGAGAGVPTLADVLDLLAPTRLGVNIELKNSVVAYPGLEQAVLAAVAAAGLGERVVLSSFSAASVGRLARLTDLEVALVYSRPWPRPLALATELGARAVHPARRLVYPGLVAAARRRGLAVRPWVVNDAGALRRLARVGVDGVFTDAPRLVRTRLATMRMPSDTRAKGSQ